MFVFHPTLEKLWLGMDIDIRTMNAVEIEKLYFVNADQRRTSHKISRLEAVLEFLRGRCIINIDKFFDNPKEIADCFLIPQ